MQRRKCEGSSPSLSFDVFVIEASGLTSHYWRSWTYERGPRVRNPSRDERTQLSSNHIGPRSCLEGGFVSKFRFLIRISLRFLAALVGLGLLGYLVFRTGPGIVWKQLQTVGWGLALDHHSGRVLSVDQDMRLATDVYVRYQRALLVTQSWRAAGL